MGIFGAALQGFGKALSKNKKKSIDPKKRLKTFKQASDKIKMDQDTKKILKDVRSASERAKKFSKKNLKKVDRGLLVGAVAKSKQPTGKMKKDVISKAKKEVDNKKNLTKIGKTLRKNYQSRKKMKR